ncbi:hypothetical protein L596_004918 [Steinernema carpocapsae]|uniref:Ubiquitin-like domain-containing protein n=1 Tax=Steinernema carpocapsae TaxID=34508 RepID=A0A4V6I899_STECR|nr:hypothetical protein L596_004918 [Steinernema carpocapsae]
MIEVFLRAFPTVSELHLQETGLNGFTIDVSALENIATLSLEGNRLVSFENMSSLSRMPKLTKLNLAECKMSTIQFGESAGFPRLHTLCLSSNPILNWCSISEMSKLPSLDTLNIDHLPNNDSREILIAKLPNLKNLNHSAIGAVERRNAEIVYLNAFGRAPIADEHREDITRLKAIYGDPDEKVADPREMKLLNLKLSYKGKCLERSFPQNISIQKLIGVSSRLLRFVPSRVTMEAVDPDGCRTEVNSQLDRDLNFYGIDDGFTCIFSC